MDKDFSNSYDYANSTSLSAEERVKRNREKLAKAKPVDKPVAKSAPKPVPEPVVEPVAEPVVEPVPEPVVEPAVLPIPKLLPQPVSPPDPKPIPQQTHDYSYISTYEIELEKMERAKMELALSQQNIKIYLLQKQEYDRIHANSN